MSSTLNWTASFANSASNLKWRPPAPVADNASATAAPALAGDIQSKLWCVHNDGGSNKSMWSAAYDFSAWQQSEYPIPNQATPSRPALAVFNNQLWCVYRGTDNGLYYTSSSDGQTWNPASPIQGNRAGGGPGLAVLNGQLYCVYLGTNSSDTTNMYCIWSSNGTDWSGPKFMGGNSSTVSLSLAAFKGQLWCLYRSHLTNNYLFVTSSSNGTNWTTPAPEQPIPGQTTDCEPAVCVLPDENVLLCVYGDTSGGSAFRYTSSATGDRNDWAPSKPIDGVQRVQGTGAGLTVMNDIVFCSYLAA